MVNVNGWAAYMPVDSEGLERRLKGFGYALIRADGHAPVNLQQALRRLSTSAMEIMIARTDSEQFPFLKGLDAHYYMMTPDDYALAMELLK